MHTKQNVKTEQTGPVAYSVIGGKLPVNLIPAKQA